MPRHTAPTAPDHIHHRIPTAACCLEPAAALKQARSRSEGLSHAEAARRLQQHGENRLPAPPPTPLLLRIAAQFRDPMVLILLLSAAISAVFGEGLDCLIILLVVGLNALLNVYQEGRADKAVQALEKLAAPTATVRRGGKTQRLPAAELVVGDIVEVAAGDAVPADLRLIAAQNLQTDEALLTGESRPQDKHTAALPTPLPPAEQANMLFCGSSVARGRGVGLVTATGADTEMGRIAALLAPSQEQTPLQKQLAALSRRLSALVILICLLIFAAGLIGKPLTAHNILQSFMLGISLAVAAIPEGLVVVVTLVLSIGMGRMSERRAIIRRLTAVETLGCTGIICCDKTGTLTQNRMQVTAVRCAAPQLIAALTLCNDAALPDIGDPTELALLHYAAATGADVAELRSHAPRLAELPFDSRRKMISTLHREGGQAVQYSKGAPELLLPRCSHYADEAGRVLPLDEATRRQLLEMAAELASAQALRLLAAAMRRSDTLIESELIFLGIVGISDPPRDEAAAALRAARAAGITPIMITGDAPQTALAIARQLGLAQDAAQVLTGAQLAELDDAALMEKLPGLRVFARVQPQDKQRLVRLYRAGGQVVAMTGDGVNDAPALKAADIGIGMGGGADVCRASADMLLTDNNIGSIVAAVEEGRRIYANIRKAIQFLLASNLSEVLAIFAATLLGHKLFFPVHLLWINLITDCFPAVALGYEQAEPQLMRQPPRRPGEGVLAGGMAAAIVRQGAYCAALTIASFLLGLPAGELVAMTMAFITLASAEIFHSCNMRSRTGSIFRLPHHNPQLITAVCASLLLDTAILYTPGVHEIFHVAALTLPQLATAYALAAAMIPLVELEKWLIRAGKK
ncbi:MAG: cation-translocating P-type ATPase [Firmicutes bacterium]|nr:cation-translocating P-type ATPase [Bacillota bacterium]